MENINANESERFGKRAAEKIAGAAEATGQKLDAAVDYVESAKQTLDQVRQEGWKGMKGRVLEYTRHEPFNALVIAVGAGVFFGWLATRPKALSN